MAADVAMAVMTGGASAAAKAGAKAAAKAALKARVLLWRGSGVGGLLVGV